MKRLCLAAGDYRLDLVPGCGGSVARFDWRGEPLFRRAKEDSILEMACFPLVPFSNRIAFGKFAALGKTVQLSPNFPGSDHPHPLHGFGWLQPWTIVEVGPSRATLEHRHAPGEWPWPYRARQRFTLSSDGLLHQLSIENTGDEPMPAGLGLHPYFPRTPRTIYKGLHRQVWQTSDEGLPVGSHLAETARDWWDGKPIATKVVDTAFGQREGSLRVDWPETRLSLTILPSDNLPFTIVFSPAAADFFCLEPVTHGIDAVNSESEQEAMQVLAPGGSLDVSVRYRVNSARYFQPHRPKHLLLDEMLDIKPSSFS